MKKPLLVTSLVLTGLMGVGLTNNTASHDSLSINTGTTIRTLSYGRTERNDLLNESRLEAPNSSATLSPDALSTTAEATSVWSGSSCNPVPIEVKPCQ